MKILTISILFIFYPLLIYSQNTITDTSFVYARIKDDCYLAKDLVEGRCYTSPDKWAIKGSPVIVRDAKICSRYGSQEVFCNVIFRNKEYWVSPEELQLIDTSVIRSIIFMPTDMKVKFQALAKMYGIALHKESLQKAISFIESCKPKGITIIDCSVFDQSEYTEGTGVKVRFYNPTSKTIKYVTLNIIGYNSVNDKVIDRGKSLMTIKAVGPIAPEKDALFNYDYVWMSDLPEYLKVVSVKVEYMDGSVKSIESPKSIIATSEIRDTLIDE